VLSIVVLVSLFHFVVASTYVLLCGIIQTDKFHLCTFIFILSAWSNVYSMVNNKFVQMYIAEIDCY